MQEEGRSSKWVKGSWGGRNRAAVLFLRNPTRTGAERGRSVGDGGEVAWHFVLVWKELV